jgi:hypothetical protein
MKCYDEPEEFTIENIEEMIHAFNDGTVLYGDNFIVQIYNSSFLSTLKAFGIAIEKNLTFVDLNECVSVLKKVWSFNSSDDLIIMKVDLLQENTLTNQLDYLIFAPTEGNKLDMTVCSSLYVKASYPLLYNSNSDNNSNSNYNISINFDLAYNLSLLGHDVFDADDPLFNDFCMNFTSSDGTDVTIKDRRNDYFQNVSLCEHNCQYLQLLFNYNRVECACPIKQNITSDYINNANNGYDVMFEADPDHSNFEVAACYQLVFDKNIFVYNIGFYIFLFFSLIQLVVWIHYVFTGMKSVLRKINQVIKPGPPIRKKVSDTNNQNGLRFTKDHPTHYDYFEHNNNSANKNNNGNIYKNTNYNYNESNIPTDDNLILSSSNSYKHQCKHNLFPVKKLSKKNNKYITTPTTSTRMNSIKTNQTFTYNNNNIINPTSYSSRSNYPLSKHHFDAPEKRPTDTLNTEPQRINKVNAVNYKDYDIINCKYKAFDKEKTAIDNQIEQLTAAKKLFISRDYDTTRGIYYDPDKQLQYEKQLQDKKELLLKNFKRAEPYNPVNNIIYDKEFLDNKDKIEEGKKLRYTIKPQLEDYYKMKTYHHDVMKDNAINNKLDYSRYKIQDKRGYDVINWNNTYNNYKNLVACKNKTSAWDELKEKAGENETFSKKQIYKAPYDKSDNDSNKYEFNIHRSAMLKQLPKLEDEETYRRKDFVRKNIQLTEDARKMYKINLSNFDKGNWFKTNRSVEMNEKVPYYNMTKPVKSQIFV